MLKHRAVISAAAGRGDSKELAVLKVRATFLNVKIGSHIFFGFSVVCSLVVHECDDDEYDDQWWSRETQWDTIDASIMANYIKFYRRLCHRRDHAKATKS